jgi:hypothetical protein
MTKQTWVLPSASVRLVSEFLGTIRGHSRASWIVLSISLFSNQASLRDIHPRRARSISSLSRKQVGLVSVMLASNTPNSLT